MSTKEILSSSQEQDTDNKKERISRTLSTIKKNLGDIQNTVLDINQKTTEKLGVDPDTPDTSPLGLYKNPELKELNDIRLERDKTSKSYQLIKTIKHTIITPAIYNIDGTLLTAMSTSDSYSQHILATFLLKTFAKEKPPKNEFKFVKKIKEKTKVDTGKPDFDGKYEWVTDTTVPFDGGTISLDPRQKNATADALGNGKMRLVVTIKDANRLPKGDPALPPISVADQIAVNVAQKQQEVDQKKNTQQAQEQKATELALDTEHKRIMDSIAAKQKAEAERKKAEAEAEKKKAEEAKKKTEEKEASIKSKMEYTPTGALLDKKNKAETVLGKGTVEALIRYDTNPSKILTPNRISALYTDPTKKATILSGVASNNPSIYMEALYTLIIAMNDPKQLKDPDMKKGIVTSADIPTNSILKTGLEKLYPDKTIDEDKIKIYTDDIKANNSVGKAYLKKIALLNYITKGGKESKIGRGIVISLMGEGIKNGRIKEKIDVSTNLNFDEKAITQLDESSLTFLKSKITTASPTLIGTYKNQAVTFVNQALDANDPKKFIDGTIAYIGKTVNGIISMHLDNLASYNRNNHPGISLDETMQIILANEQSHLTNPSEAVSDANALRKEAELFRDNIQYPETKALLRDAIKKFDANDNRDAGGNYGLAHNRMIAAYNLVKPSSPITSRNGSITLDDISRLCSSSDLAYIRSAYIVSCISN